MEEFKLKLRISPSDKGFINIIGNDKYNQIKANVFKRDNYSCKGCSYKPLDESRVNSALFCHVIDINNEFPEESECITLCKACHSTQHVDISLQQGWVQLVNSTWSQKALIESCRINTIYNTVKEDNTRYLKMSVEEFIDKFKNDLISDKAKIVFTNKFEWGDL
jgi:hypothetical protein